VNILLRNRAKETFKLMDEHQNGCDMV